MRGETDIVGFGHRGNLDALGDTAGVRQIGLDDGNAACGKTRLNSKRENIRSPAAIGICVISARRG